jgi:hypothetical protein
MLATLVMLTRLHLDGASNLWAFVRCELCADVNKYPAFEAARIVLRCKKCGRSMDVREQIVTGAARRPDVPGELLSKLSAASRMRT